MQWNHLGLRALRWLVWAFLLLVFVRGLASIAFPPAAAPAAAPPAAAPGEPDGLRAIPLLFATEYLTWRPGDPEERAQRLQPYLARYLDRQAGWAPGSGGTGQEVTGAWVHSVQPQSPSRWLVTVAARVTGAPAPRTLFLAVPVGRSGDGWVVYDYPTLLPAPAPGEWTEPLYYGQEFADDGRVRSLLTGFFRAYTSGGEAEAAYYLVPGARLPGFSGQMALEDLGRLTLVRNGQETFALAEVLLRDPATGARYTSRYTLELVEREKRWYIKGILQKGV